MSLIYTQNDVDLLMKELQGWIDGFTQGASLHDSPPILTHTMVVLGEYHESLLEMENKTNDKT